MLGGGCNPGGKGTHCPSPQVTRWWWLRGNGSFGGVCCCANQVAALSKGCFVLVGTGRTCKRPPEMKGAFCSHPSGIEIAENLGELFFDNFLKTFFQTYFQVPSSKTAAKNGVRRHPHSPLRIWIWPTSERCDAENLNWLACGLVAKFYSGKKSSPDS